MIQVTFTPSGYVVHLPDAVRTWADAFGSEMMDPGELLHLAGTLAACPWDREAIVVEIGTYLGETAVFMAKVLQLLGKRVPILSIDPFDRLQPAPLHPPPTCSAYLETIRASVVDEVCMPLAAFSQDAALVVADKIGVLVVDGNHEYSVVKRDLELYASKVLPTGLIFVDDYGPVCPGVMRAVDEYFVPGGPFTILHKTYFVVVQRHASVPSSGGCNVPRF